MKEQLTPGIIPDLLREKAKWALEAILHKKLETTHRQVNAGKRVLRDPAICQPQGP